MKNKDRPFPPGFTLVELLVVIAIIALLVGISVGMIFRFRNTGDKVIVTNNMRQIQLANISYAAEHGGRFVPPSATVDGVSYEWFENPEFISQIKGADATYQSGGGINTDLELSLMDPAVVRAKTDDDYRLLSASYGYTTAQADDPVRQAQLEDSARSAAFITAEGGYADFASKGNIKYRYSNKAIVVFYDAHAVPMTVTEIDAKPQTDIFWSPVPTPEP